MPYVIYILPWAGGIPSWAPGHRRTAPGSGCRGGPWPGSHPHPLHSPGWWTHSTEHSAGPPSLHAPVWEENREQLDSLFTDTLIHRLWFKPDYDYHVQSTRLATALGWFHSRMAQKYLCYYRFFVRIPRTLNWEEGCLTCFLHLYHNIVLEPF